MEDRKILTVVTRHMTSRVEEFKKLNDSLDPIRDQIQHLVIEDAVGVGWQRCAEYLHERREEVEGHFAWILDDDDVFTCPALPVILEDLKQSKNPDVIITRNILYHYSHGSIIYPSEKLWIPAQKKKKTSLKSFSIGSMGSSNMIVRREIYQEYIKFFSTVDVREHDWYYLKTLIDEILAGRLSFVYLDEIVMRQPKQNRGGK